MGVEVQVAEIDLQLGRDLSEEERRLMRYWCEMSDEKQTNQRIATEKSRRIE
jgi:hypothetical protein